MVYAERRVHELINWERKQRGISQVKWDEKAYELAREHAHRMAKQRRLFHSNRFAFQGGECCWGGEGSFPYGDKLARMIVKSWMGSRQGHGEYLLHKGVKRAGVCTWRSKTGVYAAWAFLG